MRSLFSLLLFTLTFSSIAQNPNMGNSGIPVNPMSNVSTEDLFKGKETFLYYNEVYIINGVKVFGTPFLYHDWADGTIIGTDGQIFTGYKLKYNAYDQSVLFQQGNDSLEVTNEIKDFTLTIKVRDSSEVLHFINANQFKKEKTKFYYEVLAEDDGGQLLRYDKKFVNDADKSMPTLEGQKFFDMEFSYFYYDITRKKLTRIKADGSNIESILGKDAIAKSGVSLSDYFLATEKGLRNFFTDFFDARKKKAF
jgi:hypothetical protein